MATADLDTGDITSAAADPFKRAPGRPPRAQAAAASTEKVKILVPKTKDQTRDVFVSHNFKTYLIKRGEPVEVPRDVAQVLADAVQTEYEEVIDDRTGRKELRPQQTMSVPFQYV